MPNRSRIVVAASAVALVTLTLAAGPGQAATPKHQPSASKARPAFAGLADANGNRLADGLDRRLAHGSAGRIGVVATFTDRSAMLSAKHAVDQDVSTTFHLIDGFAASLTHGQIRSLQARSGVLRIEQQYQVHALDDAANGAFGVTKAQTDFPVTGAGTEICIPDSGVDLGHEQLDSKTPIGWKDFINNQPSPYDDMGHGTMVASVALGDGNGPGPIAGSMKGVAPQAALSAAKVLDSTGNGPDPVAVQAIQWCAARPSVTVISLSIGSDVPSDGLDIMSQAVDAAVTGGKIVIAAAGNSGDVPGSITAPGSAIKAITVGAAAEWSNNPAAPYYSQGPYLAPFSSRGPTEDGRIKPDVIGPGVTIGTASSGSVSLYEVVDGTSFSTPYVAGVAALLKQAKPAWTQSDVRAAIEGTAVDAGPVGKDNDWGAGLLDAYAAVAQAEGSSGHAPFPAYQRMTGSVANNGTSSKTFTLGSSDLNAPIAATITTGGQLICIIDVGPLGCLQYGWVPDLEAALYGPDGFLITDSTCPLDDECTFGRQETLHVTPTQTGTYTIKVYPAADGDGTGGSYSIDLFHGPLAGGGSPPPVLKEHVGDLDGSSSWVTASKWKAQTVVIAHDANHAVLPGVKVTGVWTGNTSVSCTTNVNGRCTVSKRFGKAKASVTFTVTNLQLSGYTYDSASNHDPDADSTGTKVTVTRPA